MGMIFGLTPLEFFFSVYGFLGIIGAVLLIVVTIIAIYALKKIMELGSSIDESVTEVKRKVKKTTKLFDVILDLFSGCDDDEEDEVFVMKKKKK